ncbi:MAG TPA: SDR family oxidoreductase [Dehalococcoidales bacterium]|nr:SDR family oxidoreductase [Dehalococcoidales bacterium]
MKQLEGKIAIVTGASRGIGRAISIGLADQGASVVLAARSIADLEKVRGTIEKLGSRAEVVPTDVTKEEQIMNLFKKTMESFGRLDLLVNNAGVFINEPMEKMSTETWDRVIAIELRAPFICTREAFRIMKKQGGGRIINIGSISAQRVRPNTAPYNCAKFGLVGLTHTTALEGRPFGITCGCLHPGITGDLVKNAGKEAMMSYEQTAATAVYMACQPPDVNILELIQIPREQPYLGRG